MKFGNMYSGVAYDVWLLDLCSCRVKAKLIFRAACVLLLGAVACRRRNACERQLIMLAK